MSELLEQLEDAHNRWCYGSSKTLFVRAKIEIESLTERLAAAEAREQKDIVELQRRSRECVSLLEKLAAAEEAMKAVASLPGENWLTGQLALAEFLDGKGGEHLQYALDEYKQYEAAKGGRDE